MADQAVASAPNVMPAQTPAAGNNVVPQGSEHARLTNEAIGNFIEKGKAIGRSEGRAALMDEFRAIVANCPGRAQTAVNAFLAGQNASTVKLIVDAEVNAEINAKKRGEEQEIEIARLRAEQSRLMELNAIGGHPGVAMGVSVYAPGASSGEHGSSVVAPTGLEPEAQAKLEWDGDALLRAKNNNNERAWMLYRVNVLKGNVRALSRSA